MKSIEIIISLAFDVTNMDSVNNPHACKHAYLYTNIIILQTYLKYL